MKSGWDSRRYRRGHDGRSYTEFRVGSHGDFEADCASVIEDEEPSPGLSL